MELKYLINPANENDYFGFGVRMKKRNIKKTYLYAGIFLLAFDNYSLGNFVRNTITRYGECQLLKIENLPLHLRDDLTVGIACKMQVDKKSLKFLKYSPESWDNQHEDIIDKIIKSPPNVTLKVHASLNGYWDYRFG